MVLLYGIPTDGPLESIADALEESQTPFVILNQRKFSEFDFLFHCKNGSINGELTIGSTSYNLDEFTGIYNRAMDFSALPEAKALHASTEAYDKVNTSFRLFNDWLEICDKKVLNKASAMSSNSSKPYQLSLIQLFFKVPDTLITNSVEEVHHFREKHSDIIYKSASSVRSIVKTINQNEELQMSKIRYCPTLFQEKLEGINYRVHVVDKQVFPIEIRSESIDYRYGHHEGNETEMRAVTLSKDIHDKCIALARALQLPLAGIDLFETVKGEWYCFEVNPSPGFSYFERQTGQPIAMAIANYLSGVNTDAR
jgi:hypothetical protein